MNTILKKLYKNNKSQTFIFFVISIVNMVIVGVFTKLIFEVNKIREMTAEISRDEDMMLYFSMLIAVSLMIILFSLWILRIVNQTIFNSRKEFNIQLRLSGITRKKLSFIYIKEALLYQIAAVPIGIILMEVSYHLISKKLDINDPWIGAINVLMAVAIHLIVVILCLALTLRRITRFDPVDEMRSPYKTGKIRELKKNDIISGIIGIGFIIFGIKMGKDSDILAFLPFIGVFFIFDLVMVSVQKMLYKVGESMNIQSINLGQRHMLGYYKKINPIFTTLIVGVMVSMGLLGMFETMRIISRDTVEQNIYFKHLIVSQFEDGHMNEQSYTNYIKGIDPNAEVAYGINVELQDEEDVTNTIFAIDDSYFEYGEKFKIADGSDPAHNLNNETFDGIYLPDYFISEKDIGELYKLKVKGKTLEFKIAGRFIANGSRGRYGFVSKSYLQRIMNTDMVNALYIREGSEELITSLKNNPDISSQYAVSKDSIANDSYGNSVSGVEIFELSAFIVILISLLMLAHYFIAAAHQNMFDIARLKAMGVKFRTLRRMYVFQVVSIITQSFLFGTIMAYSFISIGVDMSLEFIDVQTKAMMPWGTLAVTYLILNIIGIAVVYLSIKKVFKSNITEYLTVSD